MIEGVQLKQLTTHTDERGFFREIIRASDEFFAEGFGQWSQSVMYDGEPVTKAWHIHQKQVDWWYVPMGVIKAVLSDLRDVTKRESDGNEPIQEVIDRYFHLNPYGLKHTSTFTELLLGDNQPAQVLRIPPGVAHGLKVLQGPAHLFYITSREYDPEDEGRIPYDALGYDWDKRDIR